MPVYHDICATVDVCQEGIDLKIFQKRFLYLKLEESSLNTQDSERIVLIEEA